MLGGSGMTAPPETLESRGGPPSAGRTVATRAGGDVTGLKVDPAPTDGRLPGPPSLLLTGAAGAGEVAVGVARTAGAEVAETVGATDVADAVGDTACVGEAVGVDGVPAPVAGVLVGGAAVFVGATGVLVGATGVLVGGTGVFVGGMGVLVGATGVFVGGIGVLVAGACVTDAATEMLPPVTVTPVMVGPPPLFDP